MAKYRLLTQEGYAKEFFEKGEIYDGKYSFHTWIYTVEELARSFPEEWEEVTEQNTIEERLVDFVHEKEGQEYPIHDLKIWTAVDFIESNNADYKEIAKELLESSNLAVDAMSEFATFQIGTHKDSFNKLKQAIKKAHESGI
jgi:hypothetical protein